MEVPIHPCHFHKSERAEKKGVYEHHNTPAEALLHRVKIVREIGHQISDLVHLIILLGEILCSVKHTFSELRFYLYS